MDAKRTSRASHSRKPCVNRSSGSKVIASGSWRGASFTFITLFMAPMSRKRNAQDAPSASQVPDTIEPTFDATRFRSKAHQVHFFSMVQHRTPNIEIPFHFNRNEFPNITAEIERRGWTYLCNPPQGRMGITLLREFYANAKRTKRERQFDPLYISRV
ncbi:hypothetical protein PIB30_042872 [Stylosanthes scabra]|uniref:Uncharacterized protein n=1 Tax=Stylosanthes scabra TaxID=79078 RepID=A0ABU6ZE36_9FABA|nr:hypothetical protein [Stylosanthes scabra]